MSNLVSSMVTNNMKELTRDTLHRMYISKEMSIASISFFTGHAQITIKNLMKEYGIQKRQHGWRFRKSI